MVKHNLIRLNGDNNLGTDGVLYSLPSLYIYFRLFHVSHLLTC
jgi:hypothetical protein